MQGNTRWVQQSFRSLQSRSSSSDTHRGRSKSATSNDAGPSPVTMSVSAWHSSPLHPQLEKSRYPTRAIMATLAALLHSEVMACRISILLNMFSFTQTRHIHVFVQSLEQYCLEPCPCEGAVLSPELPCVRNIFVYAITARDGEK